MNPQRKVDLTADVPQCQPEGETCLEMNIEIKSDTHTHIQHQHIYLYFIKWCFFLLGMFKVKLWTVVIFCRIITGLEIYVLVLIVPEFTF